MKDIVKGLRDKGYEILTHILLKGWMASEDETKGEIIVEWKTRVTELLKIDYPIIQGGLAYLAYAELAAAVSEAGGLGQITAMSLDSPEALRNEIRKVRELTEKPFGVNFAIGQHGRPYEHMLDVAIDERVAVLSVTGGNPAPFFDYVKDADVKKLVLVACKKTSS